MNDQGPDDQELDPAMDPALDPARDEQLRHLLADLGSSGDGAVPVPPDLAARLEETLAGLVAEREAAHLSDEHVATGRVVPLRPRWMPRVVAAAAAVVVLGLGGYAAIDLGSSRSGSSTAADSTTAGSGGGVAQGQAESKAQSRAGSQTQSGPASVAPSEPGTSALGGTTDLSALPQLRTASFRSDVEGLLGTRASLRTPAQTFGNDDAASPRPSAPASAAADTPCGGPPVTDGATVTPASLDAAPVALVVHPPAGGKRLVEAWSCDGTHRLASTTVAP